MPKGTRRSGSKKSHQMALRSANSDVTVYDFANSANSSVTSGRMKKSRVNPTEEEEAMSSKLANELEWYEKNWSDEEIELPHRKSENGELLLKKESHKTPRSPRKKKSIVVEEETDGPMYPLDIWFILSEHIAPEDIGRFAGICQLSHYVIHSARFWLGLYKRYYDEKIKLPTALQPIYIEKIHGMRAKIVRSLFYNYQLFAERVRRVQPFENEPSILEKQMCTMSWYSKEKDLWHFFFKFQKMTTSSCPLSDKTKRCRDQGIHPRLWKFESELYDNPEEKSTVLQVVTKHFLTLPMVHGLVLNKCLMALSHGLKYHKLKLTFNCQYVTSDKSILNSGTIVCVDPILSLRVLNWWDPLYPYKKDD